MAWRVTKPSAVEWSLLVIGVLLTLHYAWLMDDAFIYFRYADNALFLGYGLVYNNGEFVEGYSSPLWMLLLLVLRSTGLDFWLIIRGLGVGLFVLFWWLLVVLNRRMSPKAAPVVNAPLALLTTNYGVLSYFTSGLEAPLIQVGALVYVFFAFYPRSALLHFSLALTPLIRHEFVLPLVLACAYYRWRTQRIPFRLLAASGGALAAWVAFRVYYYADLLPNTFYLKDVTSLKRGLLYLHDTAATYGSYAIAPAFLLLGLIQWRSSRGSVLFGRERVAALAFALPVVLYTIKIGGDHLHYRYLAFPFCVAIASAAGLVEQGLAHLKRLPRPIPALIGVALALGTFSLFPWGLGRHPVLGKPPHRETRQGILDACLYRHNVTLTQSPWTLAPVLEQADLYRSFLKANPEANYRGIRTEGWCHAIYRHFDYRYVHSFGLTDAILARVQLDSRTAGHKLPLKALASHIATVYSRHNDKPGRGMFGNSSDRLSTPDWIRGNIRAIRVIEQKVFNRHSIRENIGLALAFPQVSVWNSGADLAKTIQVNEALLMEVAKYLVRLLVLWVVILG